MYCGTHKLKGMVLTSNVKKCVVCQLHKPGFAIPGQRATHCKGCSTDAMERVKKRDVCSLCGLYTPHYGDKGGKALFCRDCAAVDMVDVRHPMCKSCGILRPSYRYPGCSASHCAGCAEEGMQPPAYPRCQTEGCDIAVTRHVFCATHDPDNGRRSRVREMTVARYLREADGLMPWTTWNKQIAGVQKDVCGIYRPDFTWILPSYVLVLEVDELQHARPGYTCEEKRMLDIWNGYGGLPVIMIRFNPDAFTKQGILRHTKLGRRMPVLIDFLKSCLQTTPVQLFTLHRMFYDSDQDKVVQSCLVTGMDEGNFTETAL